ncbi:MULTISPECIES: rRNA maturation RNase YbeY [Bacillus]|uniref:Endoribonuclease YbeY n=2 Tax=Bacillus TaxID=1386 RepID=A0A0M5JGI3_9BACI|nr:MULTISPECIES: rRNA maturation RNase YbeY [Bacillus]ALC81664.1 rRNA maturation factor [Bacillus gobiensis]MBP1080713.1 putative rRNA maturation factor [Bacillus capparidis]MED1094569.1 rRNA maturation RNase YbeY [Bacillus capparidis]
MTLIIDLTDTTGRLSDGQLEAIEKLLEFAAEEEGTEPESEVSITIMTNEEIQQINKQYRSKDSPTDVISFAMEEEGEGEIKIVGADTPPVLGDIIISIEKANEQAEEYGHSVERELGFLAIHGFLHLLGYDHMTKEQEEEMFTKQKELLNRYGLKRT